MWVEFTIVWHEMGSCALIRKWKCLFRQTNGEKGRLATILERDTNTERETETEGGKGERASKKMKVTKQRRNLPKSLCVYSYNILAIVFRSDKE